jgi:hypothetical protein
MAAREKRHLGYVALGKEEEERENEQPFAVDRII